MGIFAGIEEVEVKRRSRYVEPGNYRCRVQAVKNGRTNQEEKPYFLAELQVITSDNPEFKTGATLTWMTMVHKFKHYFLEEVKDFVAVATDDVPENVTEAVVEFVSGEEQPLVGVELLVNAWAQTNDKTGKAYTKVEFRLAD